MALSAPVSRATLSVCVRLCSSKLLLFLEYRSFIWGPHVIGGFWLSEQARRRRFSCIRSPIKLPRYQITHGSNDAEQDTDCFVVGRSSNVPVIPLVNKGLPVHSSRVETFLTCCPFVLFFFLRVSMFLLLFFIFLFSVAWTGRQQKRVSFIMTQSRLEDPSEELAGKLQLMHAHNTRHTPVRRRRWCWSCCRYRWWRHLYMGRRPAHAFLAAADLPRSTTSPLYHTHGTISRVHTMKQQNLSLLT